MPRLWGPGEGLEGGCARAMGFAMSPCAMFCAFRHALSLCVWYNLTWHLVQGVPEPSDREHPDSACRAHVLMSRVKA
eukprot:scaffold2714_cov123-Isochrysis_galbana.AAC.1